MCSLIDLETTWNLDDVDRALAVMDMRAYYQDKKMEEAKRDSKNKGR